MKILLGMWLIQMGLVQAMGLDFPSTLKEVHAAGGCENRDG